MRVVVPVTSADPAVWAFKLQNLVNSEQTIQQWHGTLQPHVVLYGSGVKMLMQPMSDDVKSAVDALRADGELSMRCERARGEGWTTGALASLASRRLSPARRPA